jgi:hypothetical protein
MTSSRLVQFSKCEGFVSEAVRELCGNWMAWRHSIMRTYHLENGGIALLEKHENFDDKHHTMQVHYVIGIDNEYGFDYYPCHHYTTLAEAWRDWEFMVAAGTSVPVARQDVRIRNFVTGEILDTSFSQSRDFLSQLLEVLDLYWDYRYSEPDYRQAWEYDGMILANLNNKELVWVIDEMPKHGQILIKPFGFSKINA